MDSSDRSKQNFQPPIQPWAHLLGHFIAFTTLIFPILAIASNYLPMDQSPQNRIDYLSPPR